MKNNFLGLPPAKQDQYELFFQSLRHETALKFSVLLLKDSYRSYFVDHSEEVSLLLEGAWNRLLDARGADELYQACGQAHRDFFKTDDSESWFGKGYLRYKSLLKQLLKRNAVNFAGG